MPIQAVEAIKYTCDGCGRSYTVWDKDTIPGIVGSASLDGPAVNVTWFAHTYRCIGPAVKAAVKCRELEMVGP